MTEKIVRKCPLPYQHEPPPACWWCGRYVEGRTVQFHAECRIDYALHTDRTKQFNFLVLRDGKTCACGCGQTENLQVEHKIPLWKIMHLPAVDRVWYFGPENLELRGTCHGFKTASEASERAHFNTLADIHTNGPKEKKGPRLQGRGFQKGVSRPFQKVTAKLNSRGSWKPKR